MLHFQCFILFYSHWVKLCFCIFLFLDIALVLYFLFLFFVRRILSKLHIWPYIMAVLDPISLVNLRCMFCAPDPSPEHVSSLYLLDKVDVLVNDGIFWHYGQRVKRCYVKPISFFIQNKTCHLEYFGKLYYSQSNKFQTRKSL